MQLKLERLFRITLYIIFLFPSSIIIRTVTFEGKQISSSSKNFLFNKLLAFYVSTENTNGLHKQLTLESCFH
jgi:hypothetical protein